MLPRQSTSEQFHGREPMGDFAGPGGGVCLFLPLGKQGNRFPGFAGQGAEQPGMELGSASLTRTASQVLLAYGLLWTRHPESRVHKMNKGQAPRPGGGDRQTDKSIHERAHSGCRGDEEDSKQGEGQDGPLYTAPYPPPQLLPSHLPPLPHPEQKGQPWGRAVVPTLQAPQAWTGPEGSESAASSPCPSLARTGSCRQGGLSCYGSAPCWTGAVPAASLAASTLSHAHGRGPGSLYSHPLPQGPT